MSRLLMAVVLALSGLAAHAATYSYTGPNYTTFTVRIPPCGTGSCADYTVAMRVQGTFTTAAPLPPNLGFQDLTPLVTAFSFSDGVQTFSSGDPLVRLYMIRGSTDAGGAITNFDFIAQRWQTAGPHAPGDRVDFVTANDNMSVGDHNLSCTTVGPSSNGTLDTCTTSAADTDYSNGFELSGALPVLAVAPPAVAGPVSVPTLGELGLWLLMAVMAGLGLAATRSRAR